MLSINNRFVYTRKEEDEELDFRLEPTPRKLFMVAFTLCCIPVACLTFGLRDMIAGCYGYVLRGLLAAGLVLKINFGEEE